MTGERARWAVGPAAASVAAVAMFMLPGSVGEYRLAKWALTGALVAVLAGITLIGLRTRRIDFGALDLRLGALAALAIGAAAVAPLASTAYPIAHAGGALRLGLGLAFGCLTALSFAGADRAARRSGLLILIGVGAACALVVVLQAATIYPFSNLIFQNPELRASGTFGNPNWAAAFLLALVPMCLGLRRDGASPRDTVWLRVLAVLIGFAVVATRSKGGTLALAAGIAIFWILEPGIKTRVRWLVVSACAVAAACVLAFAIAGHFSTASWIHGRVFLWKAALTMIAEHPWTGIGLGGFPAEYPAGATRLVAGDANAFMPLNTIEFLYNEPLQLAVEGGLPAAAVFLLLVGLTLRAALQRGDNLSQGVGAGLAALSLYSLVDAPLQIPASATLFWFMIGWTMAGAGGGAREASSIEGGRRASRLIAATVMIVIGAIGVVQCVRFAAGNFLWTAGSRAVSVGDRMAAVRHLTAAVRYLPENGSLRVELGRALAASAQTNAALAEFDAALGLQFEFATAFFRLEMLEAIRGPSGVLREWESLARMFPLLVTPNYHIGRIRLVEGDLDAAAVAFGRILTTGQDTTLAVMFQHEARAMLHRIEEAKRLR